MAMRPRTPTYGTQTPVRSVYETFQPKAEMKENDEAYFLHVYLPGFIKERIQINFVAASRTLRIVGERPIVGGKKWSRFDQSYPVPENIEVEKLQGKFEHGTLIVTMPKKLTQEVVRTKEKISANSPRTPKGTLSSKSTPTGTLSSKPAPTGTLSSKPTPTGTLSSKPAPTGTLSSKPAPTGTLSSKPTPTGTLSSKSPPTRVEEPFISDTKSPSSLTLDKGLNDLKNQKGTQKDTSRHQNIEDDQSGVLKAKEIGTSATTPRGQIGNYKPQKGEEEIKPKLKLIMDDDEKIQEEIRQKALIEKVKRQLHEKDHHDEKESVTKKKVEEEKEDRVTYESRKIDQKYVDYNMFLEGKEIKARKESTKGEESSILKAIEKGKETSIIDKAKRNKENKMYTKGKGIKEVAISASQVVKTIREGKFSDQEKPLIANMGAAILVIVGLGAYVTYKFTSSSRP